MGIKPISDKQAQILLFPFSNYDALICDGAVRSGKTSIMSISFILWAMRCFNHRSFAFCGKSVGAVERNIINPLLGVEYLREQFDLQYSRSAHALFVTRGEKENVFYLFGGKDESSASLIQGVTLAGVLLDEVALMPRSFVEQALARCSVSGAKLWFNCNPENPMHWFRQEWILQLEKHKAQHLHFLMDDNPALDEETKERYRSMFTGVFYKRFVLGQWCISEGVIYDMFSEDENVYSDAQRPADLEWTGQRSISIDYGTTNPMRFLDIYDYEGSLYVDREYSWDSRKEHRQKTDSEYADDLEAFMGDKNPCEIIVDPSAASFIAECRRRGFFVSAADNEVLDGIRKTSNLIAKRRIRIHDTCACLIDEMGTYLWDDKSALRGVEKPLKESDHSADALRYKVNSLPDWRFEL